MNFTIVCLSYNRHSALKQLISYYTNSKVHLIIADGSNEAFDHYKYVNVSNTYFQCTYLHIPSVSIHPRVKAAVELISSEFCCFIDDSDIILMSGLKKAIDFLESNTDFSSVSGDVVFSYYDKVFKKCNFMTMGHWSSELILTGKSSERLIKLITEARTANLYYCVTRTKYLKAFPLLISNIKYNFSGTYELLWTAFLVINGKFKKLDFPFLIRTGGDGYPEPIKITKDFKDYHIPSEYIKKNVDRLHEFFPNVQIETLFEFYLIHNTRLNKKYKEDLRFSKLLFNFDNYFMMFKYTYVGSILRIIKRMYSTINKDSKNWSTSLLNYYSNQNITNEEREDLLKANTILNVNHRSY